MTLHPPQLALFTTVLLLAGCALGPDFQRPVVEIPAAFRGAEGWKRAAPRDDFLDGSWWERYEDPILSSLVPQVAISNQNVLAAEAQYRQALALAPAHGPPAPVTRPRDAGGRHDGHDPREGTRFQQ